jgi:hypothetical protein
VPKWTPKGYIPNDPKKNNGFGAPAYKFTVTKDDDAAGRDSLDKAFAAHAPPSGNYTVVTLTADELKKKLEQHGHDPAQQQNVAAWQTGIESIKTHQAHAHDGAAKRQIRRAENQMTAG